MSNITRISLEYSISFPDKPLPQTAIVELEELIEAWTVNYGGQAVGYINTFAHQPDDDKESGNGSQKEE